MMILIEQIMMVLIVRMGLILMMVLMARMMKKSMMVFMPDDYRHLIVHLEKEPKCP